MKKFLLYFCGFALFGVIYGGTLFYLNQNYSEKRWIPRIVLKLPDVIGENAIKQPELKQNELPSFEGPESEAPDFQVTFFDTPLTETELIRPWESETKAAETYGKTAENLDNKPRLAILLTDVGLDEKLFAESILRLPRDITLSFSPYAMQLPEKVKYVRQSGFENMFDIVIEGEGGLDDGGNYALRVGQTFFEVWDLFQKTYFDLKVPFVGFLVTGKMPLDNDVWQQIVEQGIKKFGLLLPVDESLEWLDKDNLYAESVENALERAKEKAIEQGQFILVMPMHPVVVQVIADWAGIKNHPEITFVPVSSLVK